MKLIMFAVFDSKVGVYAMPHFMRTKGEALREWQSQANNPNSQIGKYPHDFALFEIGEYDDSNGHTKSLPAPINLGLASEFKTTPQSTESPI